jgi:precorrin-2 dehydrogenase/sirohydrochlorin ferrochelatase
MLPIVVDAARARVILVGQGPQLMRRLQYLDGNGAEDVTVFSAKPEDELRAAAGNRLQERLPGERDLKGAKLVFVAGLNRERAAVMAATARLVGALVNVEDVTDLCDFHTPALIRRGDLVVTVSTGGKSPGLARMFREYLEDRIGPEWADRLETLAQERAKWYAHGLEGHEVSKRTQDMIEQNGWLA